MTYDVLKDFTDESFPVPDPDDVEKKIPLALAAGTKFIPASIHYPVDRVAARVSEGVLRLIDKDEPKPAEPHPKHLPKKK